MVAAASLAAAVAGCSPTGTASAPEPTQPTVEFRFGELTCERDLFEDAVYEVDPEVDGYETVEAAIDAFMADRDFTIRSDWAALRPQLGVAGTPPVRFVDGEGRVRLIVRVDPSANGWHVRGLSACGPP